MSVFLKTSSPAQVTLAPYVNDTSLTVINFIIIGQDVDLYFFPGPTYWQSVKQYHQVIGKPALLPAFAHGFTVRSLDFNGIDKIVPAIDGYLAAGFPLQTLSLREETLGGKGNFNPVFSRLVDDIRARYNESVLDLVLPFSYLAVNMTYEEGLNFTIYGYPTDTTFELVTITVDSTSGYCLDPIGIDLAQQYLLGLFTKQPVLGNRTAALWLDRNTPVVSSASLKPEPRFLGLPFYPGGRDPSSGTLPDNAMHHGDTYEFYLHATYGTELAK